MAYGAIIKSQGGDLLIDDNYDTYVYLGTYTPTFVSKTTDRETTNYPCYTPHYHDAYVDITSTTRPIVFYKPPVTLNWSWTTSPYYNVNSIPALALVSVENIGGNVWRARFMSSITGGSSSVKAFASARTRGPSSTPQGIRLYNPANQLIFDSGWKMLNPLLYQGILYAPQQTNSNVVGGSVTLYSNYTIIAPGVSGNTDPDMWISAFTREPSIFYRTNRPLTATVVFKGFSYVPEGVIAWNACWNSLDISYAIQVGSTQNTTTSVLYMQNMGSYFS